jgi:hypothetical protein
MLHNSRSGIKIFELFLLNTTWFYKSNKIGLIILSILYYFLQISQADSKKKRIKHE